MRHLICAEHEGSVSTKSVLLMPLGFIYHAGSAAGVAFMGLENAEFMWYARKVSPWAAAGYFGGIAGYMLETNIAPMLGALPAVTQQSGF